VKIFVGLLSPDQRLLQHFGSGLDRVIAPEAVSRGLTNGQKPSISLGAYSPDHHPSPDTCERFLLGRTRGAAGCLLLIDREWDFLAQKIKDAVLSLVFERDEIGNSPTNFFHKVTSRLLRAFRVVHANFASAQDAQGLSLPLRNFDASELREIVRLCQEACNEGDFNNRIQEQLKRLRQRRRPRRQSASKMKYWVDDQGRFFEFGPEQHALPATGAPHRPSCAFNAYFRFGNRIDSTRHYNVSGTEGDRTTIAGEFTDCHDTIVYVAPTTHLNMFSNDYF
jgi:hypothetical protein